MDAFDASKHDRLQQSLSSAWASFLSAQHCSHEIGALKKALDEHIRQANLSISSIQRDAADRHNSVTAAVAESKAKIEEHSAELEEIDNLRRRLLAFQQEASQDRENVSRRFTEISEKIAAQQGSLEVMRSAVFQDTKTVQEQYRLALEKIESLQGELRELRAEKMASELRLEALELRMAGMSQARQELSEEMVAFLDQVLSRRDGLMRLLDNQDRIVSAQIHTPPGKRSMAFVGSRPNRVLQRPTKMNSRRSRLPKSGSETEPAEKQARLSRKKRRDFPRRTRPARRHSTAKISRRSTSPSEKDTRPVLRNPTWTSSGNSSAALRVPSCRSTYKSPLRDSSRSM